VFLKGRLYPLQPSHPNQTLISIRIMLLDSHVKLLRCSQSKCGQPGISYLFVCHVLLSKNSPRQSVVTQYVPGMVVSNVIAGLFHQNPLVC